ncbi:MAG: DUF1329 domain-containing protein [Candidatus Binataceae bacterium]
MKGTVITALAVATLLLIASAPGNADVKPGDKITPENAAKVKDLVSPGVYYKVEHGMTMDITPSSRIDWPPPYKEATEKYSGQVRLSDDHRTLLGYVAGQPFPLIDPNDPQVAYKLVWDNFYRPIQSDDYDLRFFDCYSVYTGYNAPHNTITYIQVGHYAGYSLVGRTEVEPLPTDPNFKQTGRLYLFGLYPVLAPQSARGVGLIRYRYAEPGRGDDAWTYGAGSRRVRRLNESIMSSATGAQAWDPDHYSGFNAKLEQYDYKFLGEKQMLAVVNARHSPVTTCATDGGGSTCPEAWEMRHMYVVEANPRRSQIQEALHGKTLVYMDSEVWFNPYIDTYDQRGELFQNHIYYLAHRDRPVPDAKVAIYPFKRAFVVGAVSTDVQAGFATMCYLPGAETPERECWYINMGAVDKEFFTVEAMVKAAETGK